MAIVKAPALSMQASGNLGGICYTSYRGIQIAKGAWTGTYPNTPDQQAMQTNMTVVSGKWGTTLTSSDRETWNTLAKGLVWKVRLGGTFIPTGYLVYMKWNMRRKIMGLGVLAVAPVALEWVEVTSLGGAPFAGPSRIALRLSRLVGFNVTSYGAEYYKAGPYDSGGRNPTPGEWRFHVLRVPPSLYYDLDVIAGKWYWYKARAVAEEGTVQNWFRTQELAI